MENKIDIHNIKTHSELKEILKSLDDQGFGYHTEWEAHNKKIDKLISKNNSLNIDYDKKIKEKLNKLDNYEEIESEIKKYFSGFNDDDKIYELLNKFYISSDISIITPSFNWPDTNQIREWFAFRKKLNLKDEFGTGNNVSYYNLDKNFLKIHYPSYGSWDFKILYKLIFGEDPLEFSEKRAGIWTDLGKIEIKFFMKTGPNIKGDLTKLKNYYYNILKKNRYNTIIKYNNKIEIIKDLRE